MLRFRFPRLFKRRPSVGVVTTFRDRDPTLLRNWMRSLLAQTIPPDAVAVVDFGASGSTIQTCLEARPPFPLIFRHLPQPAPWSRGLAQNQGVRLLPPVDTVLFLDADMLIGPRFLETGLAIFCGVRRPILSCRMRELPPGAIPPGADPMPVFGALRNQAVPRPRERHGLGACQWLRLDDFKRLRGRDEGFRMWMYEDLDFHRRARWMGLDAREIPEEVGFLHQWHVPKYEIGRENPEAAMLFERWTERNESRLRHRLNRWDRLEFDPGSINANGWGSLDTPGAPTPEPARDWRRVTHIHLSLKSGLANRLRVLAAFDAIARRTGAKLEACWPVGKACNGQFDDILEPIEGVTWVGVAAAHRTKAKHGDDPAHIFIKTNQPFERIMSAYGFEPDSAEMLRWYATLRPKAALAAEIARFVAEENAAEMAGLHIRRTDFADKAARYGDVLDTAEFHAFIDAFPQSKRFFLSTDCAAVQREMLARHPGRVRVLGPVGENTGGGRTTSLQRAVMDAWILSYCAEFKGTPGSSFSTLAQTLKQARAAAQATVS